MERMKRDPEDLKSRVEKIEHRIFDWERRISDLESQVTALTLTSDFDLETRRQFLDVYRRKRNTTGEYPAGSPVIKAGSQQGGDALADATLFEQDHRTERSLYRELYGLDYGGVLEYRSYTYSLHHEGAS